MKKIYLVLIGCLMGALSTVTVMADIPDSSVIDGQHYRLMTFNNRDTALQNDFNAFVARVCHENDFLDIHSIVHSVAQGDNGRRMTNTVVLYKCFNGGRLR